jgi:hypothetical protein
LTQKNLEGTPLYSNNEIQTLKEILRNHSLSNPLFDINEKKLNAINNNDGLKNYLRAIEVECPPKKTTTNTTYRWKGKTYTSSYENTAKTNLEILAYRLPRENLPIAAASLEVDLANSILLWRISTNK